MKHQRPNIDKTLLVCHKSIGTKVSITYQKIQKNSLIIDKQLMMFMKI